MIVLHYTIKYISSRISYDDNSNVKRKVTILSPEPGLELYHDSESHTLSLEELAASSL